MIVGRLLEYLNPIAHLGKKNYSYFFPAITTIIIYACIEAIAQIVLSDPNDIGIYVIFVSIVLIIYFSFRDGVRGGLIASSLTIVYYFFILSTHLYTTSEMIAGIEATLILGFFYYLLAGIIGWLKQTIDTLIENEANERKRLQKIVQQLPVGVIITDKNGRIVLTNKQLEVVLGEKVPLGFVVGKESFMDARYKDKPLHPSQTPLAQVLQTKKSMIKKEITIYRKDKKNVHVLVNASTIKNNNGTIIAAVSIIDDITHKKELEIRKDDFVNMASHELKTPITSLRLYVDVLSKYSRITDTRKKNIIESIQSQTERLQGLVNDLLDVSRLQTGKLHYKKEEFRIDQLIEEIVADLQATTEHELLFVSKKKALVLADRFRIYQVIVNFITNAIKYSPEQEKIIVRLMVSGDTVTVSVQDFGIGVSKDQQKKIFDRLYQVTDSHARTFPGLGMGLYISKAIIKKHNGSIWVESIPEKGSTFYFSLPIVRKKERATATAKRRTIRVVPSRLYEKN